MTTLSLGALDLSNLVSFSPASGFGYGYGSRPGQIGVTFQSAAISSLNLLYGQPTTVTLGSVQLNEPSNSGGTSPTTHAQDYGVSATDEAGKTTYSKASNQPIYTGPDTDTVLSAGGFFSYLEGTGGTGTVLPDNTIASSNGYLDVPISFTVSEGSSTQQASFLAALPRTAGSLPAGTTGTVTIYHGYIQDPDVDYRVDLGSRTLTFSNGDRLAIDFNSLALSHNGETEPLTASFTLYQAGATIPTTAAPTYSITATDADKSDGLTATTPYNFTVTRTGDTSAAGTLNWTIAGTGSNPAPSSLFAQLSGTVSFGPGTTSAVIPVSVTGATISSAGSFAITLSGAPGTNLGSNLAIGTIEPQRQHFAYTDTNTGTSGTNDGSYYNGSVNYLEYQYISPSPSGDAIAARTTNVFLQGGTGADALESLGGQNVIDGGTGSNFLVGATGTDGGTDTFYTDTRGGGSAWTTIANFHAGDDVYIRGFTNTATQYWIENDGAAGYKGTTLHAELGGSGTGVNFSLTFAGLSAVDEISKLQESTGTSGGVSYLQIHYS